MKNNPWMQEISMKKTTAAAKPLLLFPYEEKPFVKSWSEDGFSPWLIWCLFGGLLLMIAALYSGIFPGALSCYIFFVFPFLGLGFFLKWRKDNFSKIFRKVQWRDVWIIIPGVILNAILITGLIALEHSWITPEGSAVQGVTANPVMSGGEFGSPLFWLLEFPVQMMGEELIKLLAFGCVFYTGYRVISKDKHRVLWIVLATAVSMAVFGMLHYEAYKNVFHCLVIIGFGSLVDYLVLLKTKNLWIVWVIHLLYDMSLFLANILGNF